MPTTHTTPIDLRGFHGREFEGVINDSSSTLVSCKGKISVNDNEEVFLCQNIRLGDLADNLLGFKYSWRVQLIGKSTWADSELKSITILDPPSSIDPQWDWKDGEEVACGSHLQKIFILINGSVIHIVNDKGVVVNSGTPEGVYSLGYRKLPTRKLTEITEEMFDKTNLIGRKVMFNDTERTVFGMITRSNGRYLCIHDTEYNQLIHKCKLIEE